VAGSVGDRKSIRPGPTTLRLLARRRRWLRWLAIALACLTAASAVVQLHDRPVPHGAGVVIVIARRTLRRGRSIRSSDLGTAVREGPAAGAAPFARPEDAVGRVAIRDLAAGEAVTPANTLSLLRYYGIAARVPRGMRAVDLVVPSAATFGGELAPGSRVDLVGAFNLGQDRIAASLLSTGIVLRAAWGRAAPSTPSARLGGVGGGAGEQQTSLVEVEVAVPASREREVALAQAFGRIFVAVHSLVAAASQAELSGSLDLRRYLGLPSVEAPATALPQVPRVWPTGPFMTPKTGNPARVAPTSVHNRKTSLPPVGGPRRAPMWTVEVIQGTQRSLTQVPRLDGSSSTAPARRLDRDGR
jgi:Flp pilus assembly protein CpaB